MRPDGRRPDELRPTILERGFAPYAEGSCLIKFGNTHVLCTASLDDMAAVIDLMDLRALAEF